MSFFDDMHVLDEERTWKQVDGGEGRLPCPRAAHGGVFYQKWMYIFGGLGEGVVALNDLWRFNVGKE